MHCDSMSTQTITSPHLFIAHFRRTKHTQEINSLFVFISRCAYFCRNKKVEIKGFTCFRLSLLAQFYQGIRLSNVVIA
ncbi:hypothetical protein ABFA07_011907 [Porites harrisoni]